MANLSTASDQEQIEALKKWGKKHGVNIIVGIAIGLVIVAGYQAYLDFKERARITASNNYTRVLQNTGNADAFLANHGDSVYATLVSFISSKSLIDESEYDQASKKLWWIIDNSSNDAYVIMARINLAKILVAQNKADEALKVLGEKFLTFKHLAKVVQGDAYAQIGKKDLAKIAYDEALEGYENYPDTYTVIKLKINNL